MKTLSALVLSLAMLSAAPAVRAEVPPVKKGVEAHPHIRASLHELQEARRELETAAHDFGGHRKEAIEAVDNAIKQLREALEYDKK